MTTHFILHAANTMVYFKQFTHNGSLRLGSTGNIVHGKGLSYDLGSSFLLNLTANQDTMKPKIIHRPNIKCALFYTACLMKSFLQEVIEKKCEFKTNLT